LIRAKIADAFRQADSALTIESLSTIISVESIEIEKLLKAEEPASVLHGLTPSQAARLQDLFEPTGADFFSRDLISKVREMERRMGEVRSALDAKKKK
jgi:hypothetical protein